ncbi:MAG: IPTL-CTERM sorting domain-containing protein [Bacteroidetes bacterium]|nr:IPTL-CTERM sorting domain-containing protein [Bacteroidota bacterium]
MKKKLCFIKYSAVILLLCFLFNQSLFSQTIKKEIKKETLTTKEADKKSLNNSKSISTQASYIGASMPAGYVNKLPLNKNGNPVVICNPCAIPNNEADIQDEGEDVTNGGCNYDPPYQLSTNINLGETRCGRINGYSKSIPYSNIYRDLDWYKLTLSTPTTVYFSAYMNFAEGGSIWLGNFVCPFITIVSADLSYGIPNTISASLPAGDYYLIISSLSFGPGIGGDYMIKVSDTDPGAPATWCQTAPVPTLSEWGLIILGFVLICLGIYYIRKRSISIS